MCPLTPVLTSRSFYFGYIQIICSFLGCDAVLVNRYKRFVGTFCLIVQGRRLKTEAANVNITTFRFHLLCWGSKPVGIKHFLVVMTVVVLVVILVK